MKFLVAVLALAVLSKVNILVFVPQFNFAYYNLYLTLLRFTNANNL